MSVRANLPLARAMRETGRPATRATNVALLPAVAAGDKQAIKQMVTSNMPLVVKKVRAYLRSRPKAAYLADEMVSAGFIALIESVNRLAKAGPTNNQNASGYLSVGINGAIKAVANDSHFSNSPRSRFRHAASGEQPLPQSVPATKDEPYFNPATLRELREEIQACCKSDDDQTIARMREQGFGDPEIAKAIGKPTTTVFAARKAIEARFKARQDV